MKDLFTGILVGFTFGVCCYFLVDGALNQAARRESAQKIAEHQAHINLLSKVCPEVFDKAVKSVK